MIALRIIIFSISLLFLNNALSQTGYLESMPGIKSVENFEISYTKGGKARKKLVTKDSFNVEGNLVLKRYSYGGGSTFEHKSNEIIRGSINYPGSTSKIEINKSSDTTYISEKVIKADVMADMPPPPPPMRKVKTYDSLFLDVKKKFPNKEKHFSRQIIINNKGQKTILKYSKPSYYMGSRRFLVLSGIEQEERLNKHIRIKRYFSVREDKIILSKQMVLDNYEGILKYNRFKDFDPSSLEWFSASEKYKRKFKYEFDKKKNWIKRLDGNKKVIAERVITYY
ncbi:MAG: hypothetical protein MRZ79_22350 [Bacteroidia bacterium]|nr:hypothetical protein [Bacteroidia bacterium]